MDRGRLRPYGLVPELRRASAYLDRYRLDAQPDPAPTTQREHLRSAAGPFVRLHPVSFTGLRKSVTSSPTPTATCSANAPPAGKPALRHSGSGALFEPATSS